MRISTLLLLLCLSTSCATLLAQNEVQNPAMAPTGAGMFWKTTGNANTVDGTHFIGTTDMRPINFRIGNVTAGRIDSARSSVFLGYRAGQSSTGLRNTAIGGRAMFSNTTGTANTALGDVSLFSNTTGANNTAIGYQTLFSNTTGSQNTAIGYQTLVGNTTGQYNVAMGFLALDNNTTGSYNIAIGPNALDLSSTGQYNVGIGSSALVAVSAGSYNTAIGNQAAFLTTGQRNTAAGHYALSNNSTGSQNTALGDSANVLFGNLTAATAIGSKARVDSSHQMVLGAVAGINGATTTTKVVIGQTATTTNARLDVSGIAEADTVRIPTNAGNQKVLMSDALGHGRWQPADSVLANANGNFGAPPAMPALWTALILLALPMPCRSTSASIMQWREE
ncbi:MAG: hypothetical protein IPH78_13590 [Bacteroidetes bacterium]|nr:hypothetical protein [Bacteroidota bacterium]